MDLRRGVVGSVVWSCFYADCFTHAQAVVTRETVNQVAADVAMDAADIGIVWNTVAHSFPDFVQRELDQSENHLGQVAISRLTFSKYPNEAKEFCDFIVNDELAVEIWVRFGFRPMNKK